jgi:hypothetical protein
MKKRAKRVDVVFCTNDNRSAAPRNSEWTIVGPFNDGWPANGPQGHGGGGFCLAAKGCGAEG